MQVSKCGNQGTHAEVMRRRRRAVSAIAARVNLRQCRLSSKYLPNSATHLQSRAAAGLRRDCRVTTAIDYNSPKVHLRVDLLATVYIKLHTSSCLLHSCRVFNRLLRQRLRTPRLFYADFCAAGAGGVKAVKTSVGVAA
jgi:hypothetical protein